MGKFLETEKISQVAFKRAHLSPAAQADGFFATKYRPYCLPLEAAEENLFEGIRLAAMDFFARQNIKWHNGHDGKPSNHLCDSQVCCLNFLFPFADQPEALADLLRPFYPQIERMLPVEDGQFVSFEWIGVEDYLKEVISRNKQRSRGALCTSADAMVMFTRRDHIRQIVLIEWKYTESYGRTSKLKGKSGEHRREIYEKHFNHPDCPIKHEVLPTFESLFYDPFYQFMRQQFLANEMEKAHELGAEVVSLLHIAPCANTCFQRVTSQALESVGTAVTEIWKKLVKTPNRFLSLTTEELFSPMKSSAPSELRSWIEYIQERYPWALNVYRW